MARPTAADHDEKAATVLDAAGLVFAERGFEGATMADVARTAGFSKAGIYHYYDSKEQILHDLLTRSLEKVLADLAAADPGPDEKPRARISVLIEAYVRSFTSHIRVVAPLMLSLELLRPAWREDVKQLERRIVDRFAEAAAGLDPPLPPRTTAFLMLGAANWTYTWYDPSGDLPVDDLARGVAVMFAT